MLHLRQFQTQTTHKIDKNCTCQTITYDPGRKFQERISMPGMQLSQRKMIGRDEKKNTKKAAKTVTALRRRQKAEKNPERKPKPKQKVKENQLRKEKIEIKEKKEKKSLKK